ncbi:hypothetical protein CPLU01_04618 [Colletotrichum plurivorum]|uniref:Uncharacterized protein n=1 Tax=Colletotrichum plurivorum TaxID=2175906 RepID=A0A8H6KQ98_9PEZI|nr:hypothetical protein CPLU01_04618 [Colletotrichum plurivorum]
MISITLRHRHCPPPTSPRQAGGRQRSASTVERLTTKPSSPSMLAEYGTFAACSLADPNQRDPPTKPTQGRAWPVPLSGHDGYQHQAVPRHPVSNEASLSPTALAPGAHRNKRKTVPSRTSATLDWSSRSRHSEYGIRVFRRDVQTMLVHRLRSRPGPHHPLPRPSWQNPKTYSCLVSRGQSTHRIKRKSHARMHADRIAQLGAERGHLKHPHPAAPVPLTPLPRPLPRRRGRTFHLPAKAGTWESGLHKVRQMMQPSPSPPAVHSHLPTSHAATICTRHGEPEVAIDMNRAPKSQASQAHPTVHFLPCLVLFFISPEMLGGSEGGCLTFCTICFPSAVKQAPRNHTAMVVNQRTILPSHAGHSHRTPRP